MENKEKEVKKIKEEKENKKEKKSKKEEKVNKQIEELTNQVNELTDKNMRISAEMVNTIRRKEEETSRLLKYANESLILEILPIIDNFERAINSDNEETNFKKGIDMIYQSLKLVLEKFEVKEIDALNKEFDPSVHQAVLTEKKEEVASNIVIEVMQKGYTYKDKVIRPAMVKVSE